MRDRVIQTQRLMAQAFGQLAQTISSATGYLFTPVAFADLPATPSEGTVAYISGTGPAFYDGTDWIVMGSVAMSGSSFTGGLDFADPSYFQLSGPQDGTATFDAVSSSLMTFNGEITAFGASINAAPGLGSSRFLQLTKNNTTFAALITYFNAETGYKTSALGLPFSFVAGDRIAVQVGAGGFPVAASGQWSTVLRIKGS